MADLFTCEENGVLRTISSMPPTHYTVKLDGFSLFKKHQIERYTSAEFKVGGYKWKLILYPNGKKSSKNISFYVMVNSDLPDLKSEVYAIFRVFLLDKKNGNYYTLQVANPRRFHRMNLEYGFDQFMTLKEFNDPTNGYLVNDTCVFGADVYVLSKYVIKGEQLEMKDAKSYKHTWNIKRFSTLAKPSVSFKSGGHKWKIELYPKGESTGKGSHITIFLSLADPTSLPIASQIYAEATITIIDQNHTKNHFHKIKYWFNASKNNYGWPRFISLTDFTASSNGYLVKDKCIIEAKVTVHGVTSSI